MTPAEPEALDKPWRFWASLAIISVLGFSVAFGFVILPVMQGQAAGIRAVADDSRHPGLMGLVPAFALGTPDDGSHVRTAARDQNHDVLHFSNRKAKQLSQSCPCVT